MQHEGAKICIEGTFLWQHKLGLRGWEVGINQYMRVGGFGWKTKNGAAEARFSQTKHRGALR